MTLILKIHDENALRKLRGVMMNLDLRPVFKDLNDLRALITQHFLRR